MDPKDIWREMIPDVPEYQPSDADLAEMEQWLDSHFGVIDEDYEEENWHS